MNRQLIDPLLQPFELKNLTLRNRVVSTSHEPSYTEDGMPKERYRLYHEEKAKGGIGLTMMGGSAVVAPDSPAAFGNLHIYKDEIVPWLRELAYGVHEHGAAVMCQITHLGRRTSNYDGDWLPVVYPSSLREPAHRAFPKVAEEWDMDRIGWGYADATSRCREAGLDGSEMEGYDQLCDAFWSPLTNHRDDEFGGKLENRLRFRFESFVRCARPQAPTSSSASGCPSTKRCRRTKPRGGAGDRQRVVPRGHRLHQRHSGIHGQRRGTVAGHPPMGTPVAPHLEFAGEIKRG
jgi:2,4-dienoyl-CoA reductase-like NADH-dependent reductase (Old Yellow Enzyme family)